VESAGFDVDVAIRVVFDLDDSLSSTANQL
jgi:hypothetical protein